MGITWRQGTPNDLNCSLSFQINNRGDALVDQKAATAAWKKLALDPFFTSAALEANPLIGGQRLIGLGASVLLSDAFTDAELARPRPDITSRIIAHIHAGQPVLATRGEVARANAGDGVNVIVLCADWRDELLNGDERQEVQTLLASSFTEVLAGFRIRRIFHETAHEPVREFVQRSIVYRPIAEFPEAGRVIHLMTAESVKDVPASLGNVLFNFREPRLRLRDSDQQLLLAALGGATDNELADQLGVSAAAVKARWRSSFARIAETMPELVSDADSRKSRGAQKRHRVLSFLRNHMGELRPYAWKTKSGNAGDLALSKTA